MVDHHVTELVELAHDSLTEARTATLLVEGLGRVGRDAASITLCERAGRPVLLCPADGTLAGAAEHGCAAVLVLPAGTNDGHAEQGATVSFAGRLSTVRVYGSGSERTAMLDLDPSSIVIEHDGTGGTTRVDLARYLSFCREAACRRACAKVDAATLAAIAEQVRVHTNAHHAADLTGAAARLSGTESGSIAGAMLSMLDAAGLVLEWTDVSGGHRLPVSFTARAEDPVTLTRSVREALERRS